MKIYLATDHAGFELKEKIRDWLLDNGYEVEDCGAHEFDQSDDYPDFIRVAAEAVSKCSESADSSRACRGIVLGGSGQGEAMVANRLRGVRAAVYYGGSDEIVILSREHNDANVLALGARFLSESQALKAVALWLKTPFSGEERHARRIAKF